MVVIKHDLALPSVVSSGIGYRQADGGCMMVALAVLWFACRDSRVVFRVTCLCAAVLWFACSSS